MRTEVPDGFPAEAMNLEFNRTVDRSSLHRWAISEVFLTDARKTSETDYVAAAQLPPAHAYYADRSSRLDAPDPLLLLECARQAETYGGHEFFGVARDSKFLLRSWSMSLPGLLTVPRGERPGELVMGVRTGNRRGAAGDVRRLTYDIDLALSGHHLGRVSIDVGYIPGQVYDTVRAQGRGRPLGPFPQADRAGSSVRPAHVGRFDPANVVLRDVTAGADGVTATVRVPLDNPSMFDHAQDHLPGMVLMEAARQTCLYAAAERLGASVSHTTVTGFDFSFSRYAELDAVTTVRVTGPEPGESAGTHTFQVEFEQDGAVIASGVTHTVTSAVTSSAVGSGTEGRAA
ncbi:AfsA-related hotdog domain-containing protein [Streptomyces sp. NPDC059037]|uniref:AfsA-related hotdog domain-containing protein n=1 Tax=Streptomyces sp. NPDC059037 TaxID=3346710 RepID=UPI0036886BE2